MKSLTTHFGLIQESLTNVAKHAGATHVVVDVSVVGPREDILEIMVKDNGRGSTLESGQGLGLVGMQERVDLLSGKLRLQSDPEQGMQIEIQLPLFSDRQQGEGSCP